jgi:choline dehydrogenase-like flavoprotein
MVTRLKEVDAVMVGLGWTGAIAARELTKAGLNVVGLERGPDRIPSEDFGLTTLRDELRYVQRLELMQDNSLDTITFRKCRQRAGTADPPFRRLPAGRRGRRHRHPLGGAALAQSTDGLPHSQRAHGEVRRQGHCRRYDDPGLAGQLRGARAVLR